MRILPPLAIVALAAASRFAFAQEDIGFKPVPSRDIVVPALSDGDVRDLIATLDSLLAREKDPEKWTSRSRFSA
jgi:hypothetical protein